MTGKSKWRIVKKRPSVRFATFEPAYTPSAAFDPLPPAIGTSASASGHSPFHSKHRDARVQNARINKVLAEKNHFYWDVSSHPAYARLKPHILLEPATTPPQPHLTVLSHLLPWPIIIQPSNGSYVTIEDVLYTIFTQLRKPVSAEEFMGYLSPQAQTRASEAYRRRYRRLQSDHDYQKEKRKGARRVDFLLEYNRWSGLISTVHGPGVWEMKVS